MTLVACAMEARRDESVARLRRALAIRAMAAEGLSQQEIARQLGVTQPAISQALSASTRISEAEPGLVVEAAAPVLKALAAARGYTRLAVFGSVARGDAGPDSDIDLIVQAPEETSSFDFVRFQQLIERVLGRRVDMVSYGGLKPGLDDDIQREAVHL
ncbi:MAG: nucleotidyltransferase domain-containing protein [Candidatus Nanopelagicales bacterium]